MPSQEFLEYWLEIAPSTADDTNWAGFVAAHLALEQELEAAAIEVSSTAREEEVFGQDFLGDYAQLAPSETIEGSKGTNDRTHQECVAYGRIYRDSTPDG